MHSSWGQCLSPKPWTKDGNNDVDDNDVEQDKCFIGDNLGIILDQYLVEKSLKNPSLERGTLFNNDCHKIPHRLMSSMIFNEKSIKSLLKYFRMYFTMPPPTSSSKNATLSLEHVTLGQPLKINFRPNKKIMHVPSILRKKLLLHSWRLPCPQNPYWVHLTFKAKNPIYMFTST